MLDHVSDSIGVLQQARATAMRQLLGDDAFTVTDDTVVVAERFQMVEAL